jgi:hypothetical protein
MNNACASRKAQRHFVTIASSLLLPLLVSISIAAQSTDIQYPMPIRANEIGGRIAPRDLGDARLTRYFYSLTGTPGDLVVIVESSNLEGDVDVFAAGTLRPLAKIPMYGEARTTSGSKTIYFKTKEPLVLRVEGRTPNDDEGTFRIRFEGAFEPIGSDVPDPELIVPTLSATTAQKGTRVTSTGARIEEPEPEPQPATTAESEGTTAATVTPETPVPTEIAEATNPPATRRAPPRSRRAKASTRTTRTRPGARRVPGPVEPVSPAETARGPRLILEMRDGMRVERYMTTVRRVTVENGQIVVITNDGKIDRQPMSNVIRMAIEP